jgi:hypothetical protein
MLQLREGQCQAGDQQEDQTRSKEQGTLDLFGFFLSAPPAGSALPGRQTGFHF